MKKTRENPTLSDSTKPYLVSQKGKIYNQFLTFCLSKVDRIYSLYKLRSSPSPPAPRPFKVYEPAITQGATFVNQNVAPLVRQMCDAWKVQGAKGFLFPTS